MIRSSRATILASQALTLSFCLAVALPIQAQDCQIGTGLGATLLLPYFEYDASANGATTIFSVNNQTSQPTLARVVLWTDWGIPTLGFDIFLKPRSVQTLNVRDLFQGNIPSTGEGENLSAFGLCELAVSRPFHQNPALDPDERAQLLADHSGVAGVGPLGLLCAGENHGDGIARGYITVDVVDQCSGIRHSVSATPASSPSYFTEGGSGVNAIAVALNRLWGDFLIIDPANGFAQGSEMVAIWSDPARFSDNPTFTFYGRYHGFNGRDERVPLPYLWATRFLEGGGFDGRTELIVWRDTGSGSVSRTICGNRPAWYPLIHSELIAWDESGSNLVFIGAGTPVFPLATQKVPVSSLDLPYDFGWMQLNLAAGPGGNNPRQAWVQTILSANGRFSLGFNARAVNELCDSAP